jgi:hypothetical protein
MSGSDKTRSDKQLHVLERWKALELDEAQANYTQRQQQEQEKQEGVSGVEAVIASTQDLVRRQYEQTHPLSADELRRINDYATVQAQALHEAHKALAASQAATAAAHAQVVDQCEQLFGIERLRERRGEQAALEDTRREQRHLDDFALLRASLDAGSGDQNT